MYRNKIIFKEYITEYPLEAFNLLSKLLDPDYKSRITADQALQHPFFKT